MSTDDIRKAAERFKLAADPTRAAILMELAEGERPASALGREMSGANQTAFGHLKILRMGGVVATRRDGKSVVYSLTESGALLAGAIRGVVG